MHPALLRCHAVRLCSILHALRRLVAACVPGCCLTSNITCHGVMRGSFQVSKLVCARKSMQLAAGGTWQRQEP